MRKKKTVGEVSEEDKGEKRDDVPNGETTMDVDTKNDEKTTTTTTR